ncbi:MAG: type II toxin-antitoxin system HicB family antitoxin [Ignavibacteriales bacterium]
MVLTLVVTKTDDGFTAEVPTIKGCESWAHDEETVIDKILDLVAFYMKMDQPYFSMDKTRKNGNRTFYKIVFNKK